MDATYRKRKTPASLPGCAAEADAFRKARHRIWQATFRQMFRESFLRVLLVCLLTVVFWGVMFALFHEGFSLLAAAITHVPTKARTVHAVYNVFFLSLLIMLGVSSGILYYASIYKSPDMPMLLSSPARASRIALEKFLEATVVACWGFILIGSPLLVAYGTVNQSPLAYFVLCLPLLLSFAVIPSGTGALCCLAIVTLAPKFRRSVLVVVVAVLLGGTIMLLWAIFGNSPHQAMSSMWLQSALGRLQLAEQRLLPSWWLSTGLLEAAHGGPQGVLQALAFQCVLLSNALLMPLLVGSVGKRVLRSSYGHLTNCPPLKLPWNLKWADQLIHVVFWPLPHATRLLLIKDFRLFRRDPLQWSQFLLFFGLLSFYFIYVRRFDYGQQLTGWMTAIGFMNLGVVGLILSTFTTRFVFPLISIEGRRFWILGTSPIDRGNILWSKFLFATLITVVPCCVLVFLSDVALQLLSRTPLMVAMHQVICVFLSTGLSAIAVGLGAKLPNLRESSPAKIAAGFGGTLTLILSAIFVLGAVIPPAVPAYLMYAGSDSGWLRQLITEAAPWWFSIGLGVSFVLTMITVYLPLRMGFRAFTKLEPQ